MTTLTRIVFKSATLRKLDTLQKSLCLCINRNICSSSVCSSVYEPDDINLPPEIPKYGSLSICMRGYDYVTLESFAKYVHSMVNQMGIENTAYPVPRRSQKLKLYKPHSDIVMSEFELHKYQRDVKVEQLQSTQAPLLMEILKQNLPEGVELTIKEATEEDEEYRYVPDLMVQELQAQIAEIDQVQDDRKKK